MVNDMSLDRRSFRKGTGVGAAARSDDELAYRSESNLGAGLVDAVAAVELARDLGGRAARCQRTPITRPPTTRGGAPRPRHRTD